MSRTFVYCLLILMVYFLVINVPKLTSKIEENKEEKTGEAVGNTNGVVGNTVSNAVYTMVRGYTN